MKMQIKMPSSDSIINRRIGSFFDYFSGVLGDCENLLKDQNYTERDKIVITVLFSIISLLSTSYCCGKKREEQVPENEKEFIGFLDRFWDSEEKLQINNIITHDGRSIELCRAQMLWRIRNLFAHEFRQPGRTFPCSQDNEIILVEPIQNISTGKTNKEFGVNPFGLLNAVRQMAEKFALYCNETNLDPWDNLPFKELYIK